MGAKISKTTKAKWKRRRHQNKFIQTWLDWGDWTRNGPEFLVFTSFLSIVKCVFI